MSNESLSLSMFYAIGTSLIPLHLHLQLSTKLTLLVDCSLDGRTLNQAFVECSSLEAAKTIVRQRDGSRLKMRTVHVALSSQGELLSTVSSTTTISIVPFSSSCFHSEQIFPTYKYGFHGLDAIPGGSATKPCPILLQSELNGLLDLCRLENSHALKAPERPYFNFVSILEKVRSIVRMSLS